MSRWCWCVLVLSWLASQNQAVGKSALRRAVTHKVVAAVSSLALIGAASLAAPRLELDFRYDEKKLPSGEIVQALNEEEVAREWRRVRINPLPHQKSVFYLLIDGFDIGWRVMHIEYIGDTKRGEPLFVGPRAYLMGGVDRNGEPKFLWHWTQSSLVGHDGLIKQNVEVEEVAHFGHPYHKSYDQTLITIKDVDLSEYEPLSLAVQPEPGTELTMLSYIVRDKNLLNFFDYPLEQRNCRALSFDAENLMVVHSCHIPATPAVVAAPIFADATLVALYYGVTGEDEAYGAPLLPDLLDYMAKTLAVRAQGKMVTMWGEIKKEAVRRHGF